MLVVLLKRRMLIALDGSQRLERSPLESCVIWCLRCGEWT